MAVVAVLRRLLSGDPGALRDPRLGEALVLAAVAHRFAACLLADLGLAPELPMHVRARPMGQVRRKRVPATALMWEGLEPRVVRPLPRVRAFLNTASVALVQDTVAWAPPVALALPRERYRVVANHVTAVLAHHFLAADEVDAYVVEHAPCGSRSLATVCQTLVAVLAPVCEGSWRSMVGGVSAADAILLTGLSRAQVFRVRKALHGSGV
ncbi:MAG TPA: hypothetical protein VFQ88_16040 [Nevskiaceae bacterium]|nr:hypothetical protein [Nevskiaceae bacterium]